MSRLHGERIGFLLLLVLISLSGSFSETNRRLHETVRHFEHLHYNHGKLLYGHHRLRRSSHGPRELELQFSAFGREFDLRLVPDDKYLHKNAGLYVDGKAFPRSKLLPYLYVGRDINDTSSRVYGSMAFGVFDGAVHADGEVYHLEPSDRYLDPSEAESHSVIYRHSDTDLNELYSSHGGMPCATSSRDVRRRMATMQRSASRSKRDTVGKRQADSSLVRCWLNVIGDNGFFNEVTSSSDSIEIRSAQAMALMRNYVAFGSEVFESTEFLSGDITIDNIQFGILDISVSTDSASDPEPLRNPFLGVEAYLTHHSEADYGEYCLSYRFTNRDFDGGVLGLAYVAAASQSGGICDDYRDYSGTMRTLNTGIVTVVNFGQRVPSAVTSITFTHEAGHNFGSPHDPVTDPECVPTESNGGNYVMFASANDGGSPNNDRFSPCSREIIGPLIQSLGQSPSGCFVDAGDLCGNSLVDPGEDCDCGSGSDDLDDAGLCRDDPCCNGTYCVLANTATCSPQQVTQDGETARCCNATTCDFVPLEANLTCREDTECAFSQICNGSSYFCPTSSTKQPANGTEDIQCNDGANYCVNGACTGSICVPLDLDDCECVAEDYQCDVCCLLDGVCTSTFAIAESPLGSSLPGGDGQHMAIGFPCANFTGFCDLLNNCQPVDSEGALSRLTDFLLNTVVTTALEWITEMWWAVVLIVVGFLLIMFFIVLGCHFLLPRPEHIRKRSERRRSIRKRQSFRRNRADATDHQYPPTGY